MKHVSLSRLIAGSVAVAAVAAVAPSPALASSNAAHAVVANVNGSFAAVTPTRVLDTRNAIGGVPAAKVAAHGTLTFTLAGQGGVPATGVSAVVLNVTATDVAGTGFVTVFPGGTTRPLASNLNVKSGQTVANLVTVAMGSGGQISLYNGTAQPISLIADVSGYYLDGTVTDAGAFVSLSPTRILDTRTTHTVAAGGTLSVQVSGAGGAGGVPASGAGAVVMNVTATSATKTGYVTAFPTGSVRPTASNLNFTAGQIVPNLVTVGLGTGGKVDLYNGSSAPVNLIADVAGYYLAGAGTKGGTFNAVQPTRILDTRIVGKGTPSNTAVPAHKDVGIQIQDGTVVPLTNVSAVVTNLTLTSETKSGFLTAYPTAPTRPVVSNLNHAAQQTIANAAIIPPGLCGKATLFNGSNGSTHMVADVSGYFLTKAGVGPGAKTAKSWGDNDQGQLGTGTVVSSKNPAAMPANLRDLHAIDGNGLAVSNDGNVWAWGPEELSQLYGQNPSTDVGFGNCSIPVRVTDGLPATISDVAGSPSDAYALDATGDVYAWGFNDLGQLGNGGTTDSFTPAKVPNLTGTHPAIAIGAGLAVLNDGTVWGWGDNSEGQLGTNAVGSTSTSPVQIAGLSNAKTVAQIGDTNYALLNDGTVWAWGSNTNGALGQGTAVTSSATPLQVKDAAGTGFLTGVSAISGGMALIGNPGTIVTWGSNNHGQLGNGTLTGHTNLPAPLADPVTGTVPTFTAIAAGGDVDVALGSDGSVWAWGSGPANGTNPDIGTPNQVLAPATGALGVGAGVSASFAIVP